MIKGICISDHENIYEIHTTNHVDHSYSYSSPTENPDVKEPEKIQSTPYFKTDFQHEHDYYQNKIESVENSKSNLVSFIEMLEDGKVGARIATDL
jgi:hypothetical protein